MSISQFPPNPTNFRILLGLMKKEIALDENDWRWATWRKIAPKTLPKETPFDGATLLHRVANDVRRGRGRAAGWDLSRALLSLSMSKQEARAWLEVFLASAMKDTSTPKDAALDLGRKITKLKPLTLADVVKQLTKTISAPPSEIALVLTRLFKPLDVIALLDDWRPDSDGYDGGGAFLQSVRKYALPYLSDSDKAALRKKFVGQLTNFPTDFYEEPSAAYLITAMIGGAHKELEAEVSSWADDRYYEEDWNDSYHTPQLIVFGLGSAALVDKHIRRLGLRLSEPHYMRAWIAHTEYAGLDYAAQCVVDIKNKDAAAKVAEVVALVRAPENAGPMLQIATRSKAAKVGADWIAQNVEHAVIGLSAVAGGKGALAEAAASRLADLKRAGHKVVVPATSTSSRGAEKVASIEAKTAKLTPMTSSPKWLSALTSKIAPSKTLASLKLEMLPSLDVDGKMLGKDNVGLLVSALIDSTIDKPHALVQSIRDHSPEPSRDAFAWRIFEDWLTRGASSKEKWAMMAVGHLGGDASALKLTPLVRGWPGQSQHQRAVLGLDVLGAIGSDVALVQLSGIAQKVKFQALKRRAGEAMEKIAKKRKMTRDELEDRIVPDGGFDADGKRTLSFGSRSFDIVLGKEATPMVKDDEGKVRADLPKPGKQDDPAIAAQAIQEWKTLKKGLREATKIQIERLEQAMVKGRAWKVADFETLLVRHPLMTHLVRQLVWGAWTKDKLTATFRVAEDGSYANEKDSAWKLPKSAEVRIVHPLDLDDASKTAWGNVFGDYEIISPFPQLGRPVHALNIAEKKVDDLGKRFDGKEWGVTAFIGKLRRQGWIHGDPQDAGYVYEQRKPFFSSNVTALIEHTGYPIGSLEYADAQKITHVYFVSGSPERGYGKRLKLGSVDAKAISEVLYDLL